MESGLLAEFAGCFVFLVCFGISFFFPVAGFEWESCLFPVAFASFVVEDVCVSEFLEDACGFGAGLAGV